MLIINNNKIKTNIIYFFYIDKNEIKKKRYTKTESTYVKNYRFSRYKQGIYAAIPYRKTDTKYSI